MRARIALCLVAALTLCFAGESAAAPKVDLTEYLDGSPQIGDFRFYNRSDGATRLSTVIDLIEHKKSTEYLYEVTDDAMTDREIGETVHGKEDRDGSVFLSDFALIVAHPKRVQSFLVVPGKPQKFKIGMTVVSQGRRVGKATYSGTNTFVGFEPINTPFGPFDKAAHMHHEDNLTPKVGGSVFKVVTTSNSWVTLELGTVLHDSVGRSFQDGALLENLGPYQYTFDHGVYQGVPYGMPVPP